MKRNKILLLIAIPFIAQLLLSCNCCDCDEAEEVDQLIESLVLDTVKISFVDDSGSIPILSDEDTLSRRAFGLQLEGFFMQAVTFTTPTFGTPFFPSASAYSCDCDYGVQPLVNQETLQIKALGAFNSSALEDSIITQKFKILRYDRYLNIAENFSLSNLET